MRKPSVSSTLLPTTLLALMGFSSPVLAGLSDVTSSSGLSNSSSKDGGMTWLDYDEDGLDDGDEVNTYGTDPLDTDTDGLKDGEEVNETRTDPLDADSDDDGLNDAQEVNTWGTDPNLADTDGDGLDDGTEGLEYSTDPLLADPNDEDTDDGGVSDGDEVEVGTDPLDPSDDDPELVNDFQFDGGGGITCSSTPATGQFPWFLAALAGLTLLRRRRDRG